MRKFLTAGLAALTLAGSMAAVATPASAQTHGGFHSGGGFHASGGGFRGGGFRGGGWHGGGWRGDGAGWAIGAGIAGLAVGAALADRPYYGYGYGPGYYDGYYDGGPDTCVSHRRVWDPYIGRYVIRSFEYAC